ncbi:MAG: EAL domain-containing protein [Spirochaetota bacterium]
MKDSALHDATLRGRGAHSPVILVADDNRINRMVVQATFKDTDYRIVEAASGREAVDRALAQPPDLVLMDLMMPEMDGLEATRILKRDERTNRIPILMLTALSETEDRINAFDAGVTGFLTKPFDRLELMAHVRSYLHLSLVNRKYILSTANRNTGLPNRGALRDDLADYEHPVLFVLQIDNIETIRRFYGDSKAAALERRFAEGLATLSGVEGVADPQYYHFSSGLFGLLSDAELSRERALDVAETMYQRLLRNQDDWDDLQYESDFTICVSVDREELLEQGELAVTEALKSKVNITYAPDVAEEAYSHIAGNMVWLRTIRNALARDSFVPYFQPIINNETREVEKYEALLRLVDEDGTLVSPGSFLVVAKNSKYYARITQLVVRKAMETFRRRSEGVAVNLSVLDIENDETREFIFAALEENPEVAKRLTIEIVEEEGLVHYDRVKAFIRNVKQFGVSIAIDDFGSGYSNFARIVALDIDYIKIDGTLIRRVAEDPVIRNLVGGIKSFAAFSNIAVVAEFVENEEIMRCVRNMGIEYSQGFCIGTPQETPAYMVPSHERCYSAR